MAHAKCLHRYVAELSGKHNVRPLHMAAQMAAIVRGADGKRLRYEDLIADPQGSGDGRLN